MLWVYSNTKLSSSGLDEINPPLCLENDSKLDFGTYKTKTDQLLNSVI